ncbi:hypothetical protein CHU98_g8795 [Xylaria longipes]|nr:hypothetical protein CHU98_g8795 [Xylaria longipes]
MATPVSQRARKRSVPEPDVVEARVTLAVEAFQTGQHKTIKAAAEAFGAPYHRTRSRLLGRRSRRYNGGNNTVLDEAMEAALHASLQRLVAEGTQITSQQLWRTANELLRLASDEGSQPRQINWLFAIQRPIPKGQSCPSPHPSDLHVRPKQPTYLRFSFTFSDQDEGNNFMTEYQLRYLKSIINYNHYVYANSDAANAS